MVSETTKSRLAAILQKDKDREVERVRVKAEREAKHESAMAEFLRLRDEVIEPTLNDCAEMLRSNGWNCVVKRTETVPGSKSAFDVPGVLVAFVKGKSLTPDPSNSPHYRVYFDHITDSASLYRSTMYGQGGGTAGPDGKVELDKITPEFLENKIMEHLEKAF